MLSRSLDEATCTAFYEVPVLAPEQMRRLQEAPGTEGLRALRDTALLATLASSGLRVSEAASLTRQQIGHEGSNAYLLVRGKNEEQPSRALLPPKLIC